MLRLALVCLVLALVAALFGFGNLAEGFADIAKVLFGLFLLLVLVFAVLGYTAVRSVAGGPPSGGLP